MQLYVFSFKFLELETYISTVVQLYVLVLALSSCSTLALPFHYVESVQSPKVATTVTDLTRTILKIPVFTGLLESAEYDVTV